MIYPVEEFGRECAWHIAEGARAKNSQAKGLDSDGTLESIFAPTKQPAF